jgi:2-amino-4-hydroxy-6-hydroxymethyldihydropteridine diphosphokinase
MTEIAYIGLGSNLGDRQVALTTAIDLMDEDKGCQNTARSPVYETQPIGPEQPPFLNQVVQMETELDPDQMLQLLLRTEFQLGRKRSAERWGPRKIDLDLLLLGAHQVDRPGLKVPHPHLTARTFVLIPLLSLAPDLVHPVTGQRLSEALDALQESDERGWVRPFEETDGAA